MVPGPGSRVPSTADISAAPHMPCAMTPWKRVDSANCASMCCGLMSPDMAAKSWMSEAVSVRSMLERSPTLISSKVRLRRTSRSSVSKVPVIWISVSALDDLHDVVFADRGVLAVLRTVVVHAGRPVEVRSAVRLDHSSGVGAQDVLPAAGGEG